MPKIHPTAVVSPDAELADDVEIGPLSIIDGPVRLHAGVRLIAQVHLTGQTEIGARTIIHPFAALGGPPQDLAYDGSLTGCRIGEDNIIRESVTVHRGTIPDSVTTVGDHCMLMAGCHVAHNCTLGNRVVVVNNVLLAGHVSVDDGVIIGGKAGVHQFVRIGQYAMLAGGFNARQDIPPFLRYSEGGTCLGANRIGMHRNGFSRAEIDEIQRLHRLIMRRKNNVRKGAAEISDSVQTDAGRAFVDFLIAPTKRGIASRGGTGKRKDKVAS